MFCTPAIIRHNRLYKSLLICIAHILITPFATGQGLKFSDSTIPINQRTSYNVFSDETLHFTEQLNIEFDIALYPQKKIGYIIRIQNKSDNNIYNLFYDAQGENVVFKLNKEGYNNLINAEIDGTKMENVHWFRMKLSFDMQNDSLKLTIRDRVFAIGEANLPKEFIPTIVFGRSDYIIDVPSFAIKNLSVGNQNRYTFALNESKGNEVHDSDGNKVGSVDNPEWLINNAYNWRFETSFFSKTVAGCGYNPVKQQIYYFNRDSMHIYNVWTKEKSVIKFDSQCPVNLRLGTNFIDTIHNKLYAYEVYDDQAPNAVMVASIDTDGNSWTEQTRQQLPTQLHHHGAYVNASAGRYTIFGGFGNMYYSNKFYTYDMNAKEWNQLDDLTGDIIFPRYFSSVGYLEKNNSIYIFGGMGNQSGEQVVGRNYFYDLHKIDLTTRKSKKLWQINMQEINVVPVRGMIILDDSSFYTLCYQESVSDSHLILYKFSLKDGSHEILGDSIPIHSDKITTNANIYYDQHIKNLYVTVQEFTDDIESEMRVYSLAFPPVTAQELMHYSDRYASYHHYLIIAIICAVLIGAGYVLLRRKRAKEMRDRMAFEELSTVGAGKLETQANSIYLFGDFMVRDRKNKDITYMFSTRLKQTLCLILQYSHEDGITSQRLSNLLWPDKDVDKVKNSRSVTINHLRKTLSELDGIELIYEKGNFKIVHNDLFHCDYMKCLELLTSDIDKHNVEQMTQIVSQGKFLEFSDDPIFDSFKESVEHLLEPMLLVEMERSFVQKDYLIAINLAIAEFNIDPLNDDALSFMIKSMHKMKMSEEAQLKYQSFAKQYKVTIGSDYPIPFKNF